jgi:putative RNA 2'-phosphotransferase
MTMSKSDIQLSKFLSLVLRHKPDEIGIRLDEAGWVSVSELLEAMRRAGRGTSRDKLEEVVRSSDKQRFAFSEVRSGAMHRDGHAFFRTPNNVWLTDRVPTEKLVFPPVST